MIKHKLAGEKSKVYALGTLVIFFVAFGKTQAVPQLDAEETAILQGSKPLVTRAGAWQSWHDFLHLKPGQEKLPLVLTFVNGADGRPKLTDLRIELERKPFASLKEFAGADSKSFDLTGKIKSGNTPLLVQGFGPSGARLVWKLTTRKPVITAVQPDPVRLADKIRIQGRNFSEQSGDMSVLFGTVPAKILSSKPTEAELQLPHHIRGGEHDIKVAVHSIKSKPFKVRVKSHPEITFVNLLAAPPGQPLIISGDGFSNDASQNIVKFGSIPAQVVSASQSEITCVIPEMHFPQWYVPIRVITDGMPSNGHAFIHVDVRVIPNEGIPMH